ncbi:UNVERIFIED_CONTAM: hypothetical protein NY603_33155, partial [Bacteroidetes bacterium 56_B9]
TKKRRRGGNDDDGFGADDDDWMVYRQIQAGKEDDEEDEEEDYQGQLKAIEAQLLEHDPDFTIESTLEQQKDWTKSLVHAFTRGP